MAVVARAHDLLVNTDMGDTKQPEWMVRVKEDYFKAGESMFTSRELPELLDEMDSMGVERSVLMTNLAHPSERVLSDALGSVAAIVAGVCMSLFGWYAADALFSVLISLLIIWGSVRLIKESTNVLLEGTPAHINLAAVENAILDTDGVADVHDLHVWTITSGREALSAHVIHVESISQPDLLRELRTKLHDRFGVDHLTIQMETPDFEDETFHFCHAGTACFRSERN